MHSRFRDRLVWITGASSGIGEALAHAFAAEGARLVLSARRAEALAQVQAACGPSAADVHVVPFDVTVPAEVEAAADHVLDRIGPVDVLVNNAGVTQRSLARDTDMAVYRRLMEVNFFSAVGLTRRVLPGMLERRSGHLVVTSSVTGKYGAPLRTGYCAAKHAVQGYFEALRTEVAKEGVAVTIVVAGPIRTPISLHALTGDGAEHGRMDPLQAGGIPADQAAREIVDGVHHRREEIVVGQGLPVLALSLRRFAPRLFYRLIARARPT